jgi:hypothetical protein
VGREAWTQDLGFYRFGVWLGVDGEKVTSGWHSVERGGGVGLKVE